MTTQNLGTAVYTLDVADGEFNSKINAAERASGNLGTNFASAAGTIGRAAVGLAAGILAIASPFQDTADQIRQAIATATGAAGEDLDLLSDQVRDVAARWGRDWAEAGDIVAAVANIDTVSEAQVQQLLDLTAAFQRIGGDANDVALTVNTAVRSINADIEEASDVVAALGIASQGTGVEVGFMARAFRRAAGDANDLGLSATDLGVLIVTAAEIGGEALVTRLSPALDDIIRAIDASDLSAEDFNTTMGLLFQAMADGATNEIARLGEELGLNAATIADLARIIGGLTDEELANLLLEVDNLAGGLSGSTEALVNQNLETLTATERWRGLRNQISGFIQEELSRLPGAFGVALAASADVISCLLYTSPSPRDRTRSRMPSSA